MSSSLYNEMSTNIPLLQNSNIRIHQDVHCWNMQTSITSVMWIYYHFYSLLLCHISCPSFKGLTFGVWLKVEGALIMICVLLLFGWWWEYVVGVSVWVWTWHDLALHEKWRIKPWWKLDDDVGFFEDILNPE